MSQSNALIALRGWLFTGLGVATALLISHERVRLAPVFAMHPLLHCFATGVFALAALAAIGWYVRASRGSFGSVACAVLAVPATGLAISIAAVNFATTLRTARQPVAQVSYDDSARQLNVTGRIGLELATQLSTAFAEHRIERITIDSLGGHLAAAEAAGRYLQEQGVPVRVVRRCASACVPLWALAAHREIELDAVIGLHRSHLGDQAAARGMVRVALEARAAKSAKYLESIGFPRWLIEKGQDTAATDAYWVTALDLAAAGVDLQLVDHSGRPLTLGEAQNAAAAGASLQQ